MELRLLSVLSMSLVILALSRTSALGEPPAKEKKIESESRTEPDSARDAAKEDRNKSTDPPVTVVSEGSNAAAPGVARLYMVLSTESTVRSADLKTKITLAARFVAPNHNFPIEVRSITRDTFEELGALINEGPAVEKQRGVGIQVAPFVGKNGVWTIATGNPDDYLTGIDLNYTSVSDSKTTTTHFDAKSKSDTSAELRYHKPGVWILALDPKSIPKKATLHLKDVKGVARTVPMKWPVSDQFFIVTIENFPSTAEALKQALGNRKAVGTPLESIGEVKPMSLVLLDLRTKFGTPENTWTKNTFEVKIPGLKDVETSRVWVLFPLSRKQLDKELAALNDRVNKESQASVSQMIRERQERSADVGEEGYVMRPNGEPRWYELVGGNDEPFRGKFKLEDADKWVVEDKSYWLKVFEFGDGPTAIPNPLEKEVMVEEGIREKIPVVAFDEEVPDWPKGINNLKTKKPK